MIANHQIFSFLKVILDNFLDMGTPLELPEVATPGVEGKEEVSSSFPVLLPAFISVSAVRSPSDWACPIRINGVNFRCGI